MKLAHTVKMMCLACCAAMISPIAAAEDSGWYGGLGVGRSRATIDDSRINASLLSSGFSTATTSWDQKDTSDKFLLGYKFNPYFSLEGGYFDLGQFTYRSTTVPAGTLDGKIDITGWNLDAVGMLPVADKLSAFARVGLQYAEAKDSFIGTGAVAVTNPNPSKRDTNIKYGVGLQYDINDSVGLRGEWERYRINDGIGNHGDVDTYTVGLVVMFGGEKPAPAPRAAAAPPAAAPVAVVAAPPMLVIVPIPPARTQQYCSILDIQFDIDQKTVQREYEEKIDKVAIFMRKYPETTAVIEGHSDEVGTTADNMELSLRRAESVVNYLVAHGIARSRLKAVGFGETRPIADNRTEAGKRMNRRVDAIIACATDIEGLTPAPARITMALEMEFDTNQADVRPQYREELRKVANFMKANPGVTATVEGHTSNQRGGVDPVQAMQLSQRRAQNVVNYLASNFDIARSRLSVEGFGATRRFAYNTSAEGQQENRRVNIIFMFPK